MDHSGAVLTSVRKIGSHAQGMKEVGFRVHSAIDLNRRPMALRQTCQGFRDGLKEHHRDRSCAKIGRTVWNPMRREEHNRIKWGAQRHRNLPHRSAIILFFGQMVSLMTLQVNLIRVRPIAAWGGLDA